MTKDKVLTLAVQQVEVAVEYIDYLGGESAMCRAALAGLKKALAQPVQPDNTSKLYEELRSIIDSGSESFTHKDAVQYLKDMLAPQEHAEQMARLGWQYFECPACGSEGARAFPKPEQGSKPKCFADFQPNHEVERKCQRCTVETECKTGVTQPEQSATQKIGCVNHDCDKCKAQPEQESVSREQFHEHLAGPFYTAPSQREWVGLTDEDICACFEAKVISDRLKADARRIEAKLKEKNL